ncbi:MAG: hypothetical protein ABEH77_07670, partial [Halobacteriaceae archaeon]
MDTAVVGSGPAAEAVRAALADTTAEVVGDVAAADLAVAVGVRVYGLTHWSLWLDEVYTLTFRAAVPLREALVVPFDPHP